MSVQRYFLFTKALWVSSQDERVRSTVTSVFRREYNKKPEENRAKELAAIYFWPEFGTSCMNSPAAGPGPCTSLTGGALVEQHGLYLEMRLKIDSIFEHYAAQSEHYQRANIAQRFAMEDAFYRLSMELLAKILGPFKG